MVKIRSVMGAILVTSGILPPSIFYLVIAEYPVFSPLSFGSSLLLSRVFFIFMPLVLIGINMLAKRALTYRERFALSCFLVSFLLLAFNIFEFCVNISHYYICIMPFISVFLLIVNFIGIYALFAFELDKLKVVIFHLIVMHSAVILVGLFMGDYFGFGLFQSISIIPFSHEPFYLFELIIPILLSLTGAFSLINLRKRTPPPLLHPTPRQEPEVLINCPNCSRKIPDTVITCPYCEEEL
ncbi:MAG: hypothetical protein ACFFCS_11200 [Candidatus Hodarchaeota archaeon]